MGSAVIDEQSLRGGRGCLARQGRRLVRALVPWLAAPALAALFAAGTFTGCTQGTTTAPYTLVTGIELPASDIAAGHGCGLRADQVYKYGAMVGHASPDDGGLGDVIASHGFDCF